MKAEAVAAFRGKLRAGQTVRGIWITTVDPAFTEIAVGLGLDFVVIDTEHGAWVGDNLRQYDRCAATG
jgi:2-keto-3-deoxy-L-rhamnonate aldolase RhmA